MKKNLLAWLAACLFAVGCGGSGSGSSNNPGAGTAQVNTFVTDAQGAYDHVWVTVYKIDLTGPSGSTTVFDSSAGQVVDLASLNVGGQSMFSLLGVSTVPAGTYTNAKITLSNTVTVVRHGQTNSTTLKFSDGNEATNQEIINVPLQVLVQGKTNIVLDFVLSEWQEHDGKLTAVVRKHSGEGLGDEHRLQREDYEGQVANLAGTAPNLTFDLKRGNSTMSVTADSTTSIFNADGTANPSLSNGQQVHVKGVFDTTTQSLKASAIRIQTGQSQEDQAQVDGQVTSVATDGFVLTAGHVDGFVPTASTVTVKLTSSTVFFSDGGVTMNEADFLAALAAGVKVEAEGTYDAAANTLTATKVKLDVDNGDGSADVAQVVGAASAIDATAHTLSVTVNEWEGVQLTQGQVLNVVVNGNTHFDGGLSVTDFFTQLTTGGQVKIEGTISGNTLTATHIGLSNHSGG